LGRTTHPRRTAQARVVIFSAFNLLPTADCVRCNSFAILSTGAPAALSSRRRLSSSGDHFLRLLICPSPHLDRPRRLPKRASVKMSRSWSSSSEVQGLLLFSTIGVRLANFADGNECQHGKDRKSYYHRATPSIPAGMIV
jgi:hypothetical protein